MITVNSLSGGKTSSYMAAHFPADYEVFSLVRIDDPECSPPDKKIIQKVSDKIGMEFIATAEDDITLYTMFDLEQKIGREITWVTGISFDKLIKKRSALPNKSWRFCTTEMKMRAIFEWWFKEICEKVDMRIGYRYDEQERKNDITNEFKAVVGKQIVSGRNKWAVFKWRDTSFPLIDAKVIHPRVYEWSKTSGLEFPPDSNCVGCFWKNPQQLRKNWDTNPKKMKWFAEQGLKRRATFKDGISYNSIKNIMLQLDFAFGEGAGCKSGEHCTP